MHLDLDRLTRSEWIAVAGGLLLAIVRRPGAPRSEVERKRKPPGVL